MPLFGINESDLNDSLDRLTEALEREIHDSIAECREELRDMRRAVEALDREVARVVDSREIEKADIRVVGRQLERTLASLEANARISDKMVEIIPSLISGNSSMVKEALATLKPMPEQKQPEEVPKEGEVVYDYATDRDLDETFREGPNPVDEGFDELQQV